MPDDEGIQRAIAHMEATAGLRAFQRFASKAQGMGLGPGQRA